MVSAKQVRKSLGYPVGDRSGRRFAAGLKYHQSKRSLGLWDGDGANVGGYRRF